ncbi:TPA: hypothetical protein PNO69_004542 [Salmonella enterica]|nr:hypothetical protein [Salmonella enterica]HCH9607985.1 hypothetical protein [Salmonella enterica]HDI5000279.1 hypothetical protein [Salmonella enterica]HDI5005100.1 hypothetical protein [Salmonella enterica]
MSKAKLVLESKGSARNLLDKVLCSKERIPDSDHMFNRSFVDKEVSRIINRAKELNLIEDVK